MHGQSECCSAGDRLHPRLPIVLRTLRLFNDLRKYQHICFDTKVMVTFMCYCPMTVLQLSYSVVCPELDMLLVAGDGKGVSGTSYTVPADPWLNMVSRSRSRLSSSAVCNDPLHSDLPSRLGSIKDR